MTETTPAKPRFLFAAESGLALFENRQTGRRFWLDLEHWQDLAECVRSGWVPEGTRHPTADG